MVTLTDTLTQLKKNLSLQLGKLTDKCMSETTAENRTCSFAATERF